MKITSVAFTFPLLVTIDGDIYENYDPNQGFSLGTIEPLASVTVSFTVTVIQQPTHDSVLNYAVGTFNYKVNPAIGS